VSWAFEMEILVLGWYILTETGSVALLTLFASLQYVGTLFAPMFGVIGHRIGNKKLLCGMRALYALLAIALLASAVTGALKPLHIFLYSALIGMVRPSDAVMRFALIGETTPTRNLMSATGIQRTTNDSARLVGYLTGAGIFALLGIEVTIFGITCLYFIGLILTFKVAGPTTNPIIAKSKASLITSPWKDLRDTVIYVWTTPPLLAVMCLAFLVNMTAFPLINGLLPVVAKDVYGTDQIGLGYLAASFAFGALVGSVILGKCGDAFRQGRTMMIFSAIWYTLTIVFAQMSSFAGGVAILLFIGFAQSLCIVPMSALLLHTASERFRSRVLGIRILAVYGVPIGLLCSGPLIGQFAYPMTATIYCLVGLSFTALIAIRWGNALGLSTKS
jgi:MFS family permease